MLIFCVRKGAFIYVWWLLHARKWPWVLSYWDAVCWEYCFPKFILWHELLCIGIRRWIGKVIPVVIDALAYGGTNRSLIRIPTQLINMVVTNNELQCTVNERQSQSCSKPFLLSSSVKRENHLTNEGCYVSESLAMLELVFNLVRNIQAKYNTFFSLVPPPPLSFLVSLFLSVCVCVWERERERELVFGFVFPCPLPSHLFYKKNTRISSQVVEPFLTL